MDAQTGDGGGVLTEHEQQQLARFPFHQLALLLEARTLQDTAFGHTQNVSGEQVRFRATPSLGFPASEVSTVTTPESGEGYEVWVNFMGLYGPSSPLPAYYTEALLHEDEQPSAARDFLDLFNHRLIGLLHRVWKRSRYYLRYEDGGTDEISLRLAAIMGLQPTYDAEGRLPPRPVLLPQLGLISMYSRSASLVGGVLEHCFRVPVEIEEFVWRTVDIDPRDWSRLGTHNTILGEGLLLGEQVDDPAGKFRVHLGPMSYESFRDLLPDHKAHQVLVDLVLFVVSDPLDWEIECVVEEPEACAWRLGSQPLGWATWLGDDARAQSVARFAPFPRWQNSHWHQEAQSCAS